MSNVDLINVGDARYIMNARQDRVTSTMKVRPFNDRIYFPLMHDYIYDHGFQSVPTYKDWIMMLGGGGQTQTIVQGNSDVANYFPGGGVRVRGLGSYTYPNTWGRTFGLRPGKKPIAETKPLDKFFFRLIDPSPTKPLGWFGGWQYWYLWVNPKDEGRDNPSLFGGYDKIVPYYNVMFHQYCSPNSTTTGTERYVAPNLQATLLNYTKMDGILHPGVYYANLWNHRYSSGNGISYFHIDGQPIGYSNSNVDNWNGWNAFFFVDSPVSITWERTCTSYWSYSDVGLYEITPEGYWE
jgi:hypothetical protein